MKRTTKNLFSACFWALMLSGMSWSCVEDSTEPDEKPLSAEQLAIGEAKEWFGPQEEFLVSLPHRLEGARQSFPTGSKVVDWDRVLYHAAEGAIEVSLDYSDPAVAKQGAETVEDLQNAKKASFYRLILKETTDGYERYIMKYFPLASADETGIQAIKRMDANNFSKLSGQFAGEIRMYDWEENLIKGWKVVDGKIVESYRADHSAKKGSTAASALDCVTYMVATCVVVSEENPDYDPSNPYNEDGTVNTPFISTMQCYEYPVNQCIETDDTGTGPGWEGDPEPDGPRPIGDGGGNIPSDEDLEEEDEIINQLTGKAACVYEKLMNLEGGFKDAIKKFDGDFPVAHLKFQLEDLEKGFGVTIPPQTIDKDPNYHSDDYVITIKIDSGTDKEGVNQRPNVMVAKTIVHEVIHAEMVRKLMSLAGQPNFNTLRREEIEELLSKGDFPSIYEYYRKSRNWQHNLMADYFQKTIANVLQEFDTGKSVPNGEKPDQLYLDLAWEGLRYNSATSWNSLGTTEQNRIKRVISDYLNEHKYEKCE